MCAPSHFHAEVPLLLSQPVPVNVRLVRVYRIAAFALSCAIVVAAIVVLIGWATGIRGLTTLGFRGVAMNPLAAVCLALLAAALLLVLPGAASRADSLITRMLASIACGLGAAKLATVGSLNGADTLLFRGALDAVTPVNRMTPTGAAMICVLAVVIVLLDVELRSGRRPAQLIVFLALPLTLLSFVRLLFGVTDLSGWGSLPPTAHAGVLAVIGLELAILFSRVEHSATRIFVASGPGGVTARRLLPAAIVLPLAFGYARLAGQRAGLYGSEFGTVLLSLSMIATFSILVWWTAWSVERVDSERVEVDVRLQALIRHTPLGIVLLDRDGCVQLCNDAFVELFHYSQAELLGKRVDDLIAPPDDDGETVSMTQRGFAGESVRRSTVRRRRDGALVPVELFVVPLAVNGRPVGTYGVYRDLTEQQRLEARKREALNT
jgi:PAS domain S-box-containing protein